MKKTMALLMAVMMSVSLLAGCGSNGGDASSVSDNGTSSMTVSEGKLIMATNAYFPPYEYYEGNEIVGVDVEIAQAIADKLDLELQIEDMEFDSVITSVQTGKVDMGLAGLTVTPDREKSVAFSQSYATGIQSVIVREDSDIKSLDDLNGKKIGVQLATTGDIYASSSPEDGGFGEENVEKYNKGNDAVMALTQGKVDAVIIDNEPAKSYVASTSGLTILDTEYAVEDYAICMNKNNTALQQAVKQALTELNDDGTLQKILDKYITAK